jgi:hypothetical protein
MSITKEKMTKNAIKFNATGIKYNVINDKLLEMLGVEFISAPCSTSDKLYNAYEGGLIAHILETTKQAIMVNNSLPEEKQVDLHSLIRVCMIHQIGKAQMFLKQDNEWFIKNKGEHFKFNDMLLSMKTGERSTFYALKAGIDLTEHEVFAIYNQDFDFGHRKLTSKGEKLAAILKVANLIAIMIQK